MDKYNFVVANKYLEDFIWEDYCNKYLEFIKPLLRNPKQQSETISVANTLFKNILVMLHPFAPFVTEKIYLKMYSDQKSIMLEKWPTLIKKTISPKTKMLMQGFNSIYSFIRDLRIKNGIKQSVKIETNLITNNKIKIDDINRLLEPFNVLVKKISSKRIDKKANLFVIDNQTIEYFDNFISAPEQLNKLEIEKNRLENEIKRSQTILQNKNFLAHAPREKVQEEEKKYVSYKEQYQKILENIKKIN
jgi:valyl-tRNA synthetase